MAKVAGVDVGVYMDVACDDEYVILYRDGRFVDVMILDDDGTLVVI